MTTETALTVNARTGEIVQASGAMGLAAPLTELVQNMRDYQAAVGALLVPDDYQRIGNKEFKKKSAWRKLATAFSVSTQIVSKEVAYDEAGRIHHAEYVIRATARNGRYVEAWGGASVTDRDFSHDQDVAATAQTRATSRAISDLIGAGEVSAEEMADEQRPPRRQQRAASPKPGPMVAESVAPRAAPDVPSRPLTVRVHGAFPDKIEILDGKGQPGALYYAESVPASERLGGLAIGADVQLKLAELEPKRWYIVSVGDVTLPRPEPAPEQEAMSL